MILASLLAHHTQNLWWEGRIELLTSGKLPSLCRACFGSGRCCQTRHNILHGLACNLAFLLSNLLRLLFNEKWNISSSLAKDVGSLELQDTQHESTGTNLEPVDRNGDLEDARLRRQLQ